MTNIGEEPGWVGAFTRSSADGALKNGTRIVKCNSEQRDVRTDGAFGVVLGSISHAGIQDGAILYFVEWDMQPRVAVACIHFKVKAAEPETTPDSNGKP